MSLVKSLNRLKNNIFGGPGNTGFSKPPAYKTRIKMQETPVGLLDDDPLRFGTYQFPKDIYHGGQIGHYMVFYVNKMVRSDYSYGGEDGYSEQQYQKNVSLFQKINNPFELNALAKPVKKVMNTIGETKRTQEYFKNQALKTMGKSTDFSGTEELQSQNNRNKRLRTGIGSTTAEGGQTRRITDSVALYMPPNIQDNTSATYDDMATGLIGFGAGKGMNFIQAMQKDDFDAAGDILADAGVTVAGEAFRRSGMAIAEALTGTEGGIQTVNRVFGRADNPFLEVFFNSMNMRSFTYNFNLAPRNEEETMEIQRIIQLFRFHMAPEMQETNGRYLTLPSEFDIHYMMVTKDGEGRENDYFNRIATCVLTDVATNYTPGEKLRTFEDGAPTQITLSLTFKETEMLTKEKINEGY